MMKPDMQEAFIALMGMFDHPHQWYGGRTYAQHGDDLAIINLFGCLRIARPSYLDIGAHHPFHLSNTALLYQRGSRGINVEANPALIEEFKQRRPEDVNVCAAVVGAPNQGTVVLNRLDEASSGLNSLLPIQGHKICDTVEVPAVTADEIVNKYADGCWPDLLSIDAEGMDAIILRSIDYKRGGPKVICAEAVSPQAEGDVCAELRALMAERGYAVHSFAGSNMLFVRCDLIGMCR
jgi:FkbM family methyltransferase